MEKNEKTKLVLVSPSLSEVEFDFTQLGTREELDERDREVIALWGPLRDRAAFDPYSRKV